MYRPAPIRSLSPAPRRLSRSLSSPLDADDVTQRVRQQTLITRFNDLFAVDRLDALDILRRYSDDFENNQRIVFAVVQVSFMDSVTLLCSRIVYNTKSGFHLFLFINKFYSIVVHVYRKLLRRQGWLFPATRCACVPTWLLHTLDLILWRRPCRITSTAMETLLICLDWSL